jgi:iron complex transport system substrate-binding protein
VWWVGFALFMTMTLTMTLAMPANAASTSPSRVISLNPSLTAILLALDEGERLIGIDDFSAQQIPEVAGLPRVGGLFNPSLEAVVALQPDMVLLVPSAEQRDFKQRLEDIDIEVVSFKNFQFDEVLENILRLGEITGARKAAAARVAEINTTRAVVERAVKSVAGGEKKRPSIALILQRDPLYVVGGANFIDTMVGLAGGRNVASSYHEAYPRVAMEWLVAQSPEVLVDLSPEAQESMEFWKRWPTIGAVKSDRLVALGAGLISMPGPDLDKSILLLARTFWGKGIDAHLEPTQPTPQPQPTAPSTERAQ